MPSRRALYLSLLSLLASTMAAPVDTLADLRCYCITFSLSLDPVSCALPLSKNLDWHSARSLASAQNLNLEFASSATLSRVLQVEAPLPTSALLQMNEVAPTASGSKIVCGFGDEVERRWMKGFREHLNAHESDRYLSKVLAFWLLIIILYAAGEYVWIRYFGGGRIKLEGKEKDLMAYKGLDVPHSPCTSVSENGPASPVLSEYP